MWAVGGAMLGPVVSGAHVSYAPKPVAGQVHSYIQRLKAMLPQNTECVQRNMGLPQRKYGSLTRKIRNLPKENTELVLGYVTFLEIRNLASINTELSLKIRNLS